MTLAANRLLRLNVACPTSRVVSLSPSGVDLKNVSSRLIGRYVRSLVTSVARRLLEMRSVPEVVKTECRPERRAVLHRVRLVHVTRSARRELVVGLVGVARVALGVFRHAGLQALVVEAMTEITSWRALGQLVGVHLPFHLLGICMVAMRETFETELRKLRRKRDQRPLSANRNLVAHDAQLALQIRRVFAVTNHASRVSWKQRCRIVARPQVAGSAILRFGLVLFAIVIERRGYID